jgi:exonuclease SbcC
MLIEKVELKNIKPYREHTFEFAPGINVLSGPNGAGKSTVFEAIGYALFGVEAQTFIGKADRFVRKGAKRGHVRVHFRADGGQRYVIERRVGTDSTWRLAEKKTGETEEVIEVKDSDELEGVLKKVLFANATTGSGKLAKTFLDVIGPLQNEFLGPFVKKGQSRIDDFDRILGISAWREAYKKSSQLESEAKSGRELREGLLGEKQNQVVNYDQVTEELKAVKQQLIEKQQGLAEVSDELKRTGHQLDAYEKTKTEIDRLEKDCDRERHEYRQLEISKQAREENLAQAQAAKQICRENAAAHAAYCRAEEQLATLRREQKRAEEHQKKIDALEKQIASRRGQIESDTANLARQESSLKENLETAKRQLREVEKQMQEIQAQGVQAKADRDAYKTFIEPLSELDQASPWRDAALKLVDEMAAVRKEVADDEAALADKVSLEREAAAERVIQDQVDRQTTEQATLAARKQQLVEGNEKLAGGQCPFFAEPCLNLKEKAQPPSDFFAARISLLEEQERAGLAALNELAMRLKRVREAQASLARLEQIEKQLEKAKQKAKELTSQFESGVRPSLEGALVKKVRDWVEAAPTEPQRAELRQEVERLKRAEFRWPKDPKDQKTAVETFAEEWKALMAEMKRIAETRLAALDEQYNKLRQRYAARQAEMKKLEEACEKYEKEERQLATHRAALQNQEQELADQIQERDRLIDQAKQFQDVPQRIEEQEAVLVGARAGYSAYEQNRRQSEQVEPLEQEVKEITEKLTASAQKIIELEAGLNSRRAEYDEKAHQDAREQQMNLAARHAKLATELESTERDLTRLEQEKARLDVIRQEIRALESEIKQYKRTHKFIQDLRAQVFNKVSERLSERFREEVSRLADRIYRVIAESNEELRWGSGYSIELVDFQERRERVRSDEELSGGEMMNAVVALRLALLQTTGSKIGFFDEPTSNLDESRRANLAQAFHSLDVGQGEVGEAWYDQLFLISHDVAFTEITDQIIHLVKATPTDGEEPG